MSQVGQAKGGVEAAKWTHEAKWGKSAIWGMSIQTSHSCGGKWVSGTKASYQPCQFWPSTVALWEIQQYQKTINPLICWLPFQQLIRELGQKLGYADFGWPFLLETDASMEELCTVLSQKDQTGISRVIAYASRMINEQLELLPLKWAAPNRF